MDRLLVDIQKEGLYTRHECNLCCQRVEMDGHEADVRAAVCDGLTAVRRPKCATYGCPHDLCGRRGARYCAFHEEERGHMCNITDPPCPRLREEGSLVCSYHSAWEQYYLRYIRAGGWHATSAAREAGNARETQSNRKTVMASIGQELRVMRLPSLDSHSPCCLAPPSSGARLKLSASSFQPRLIKYLRSMLGPRHTFGSLICTWSCGIMAGISPLFEAEGDAETAAALDDIWQDPAYRPTILFYDRGCKRRRFLRCHPDPTWVMTINIIDRFHYRNHDEPDCTEFCSPERKDCPLLWRDNGDDEPTFRWNSSRAESSNSILHGLGPCVSNMTGTVNRFVLMTVMLTHNELLLREKLNGE
ncbi:unnamed protein product [Ectocarpus fasciculatus]